MDFLTQPITIHHFLLVSAFLFIMGFLGLMLNRKSLLKSLMCLELILLSVNLNFVSFSTHLNDMAGQIFSLFILTVAAAEVAIGLAILVVYFRTQDSVDIDTLTALKG
jgi:NADH-quinone oxidoreductase subunit K